MTFQLNNYNICMITPEINYRKSKIPIIYLRFRVNKRNKRRQSAVNQYNPFLYLLYLLKKTDLLFETHLYSNIGLT